MEPTIERTAAHIISWIHGIKFKLLRHKLVMPDTYL
jgi:hypothetical protein